ncbi:hypothetical protein BD410DRAFT_854011 [Rickenella mellea]|uniref:Uncharacterized protein n=1 Tax=Rickenella mellea TaxID=50990 RepID=A0A4Y7Q902_9AGAM|nr:hypothetical protein BD410DRAFT_854011 [Rickenella mellea]
MELTRGTVKLADPHPDGNDCDDEGGGRCRCARGRVAVEVSEDGRFTWRFVPDARRAPGVDDEGAWPRVVDFCGENVEMTRDEWDIYKLDGAYDCLVRPAPLLTRITPAASSSTSSTTTQETLKPPQPHAPKGKRRLSTSPSLRPHSIDDRDTPTTGVQKKFKTVDLSDGWSSPSDTYDDDDEVEKMVVDGGAHRGGSVNGNGFAFGNMNMNGNGKLYLKSERLRKVRANKEEARRLRKEWTERWRQRRAAAGHAKSAADELDELDGLPSAFNDPPIFSTPAPLNTAKRKAQTPSSTDRSSSHPPDSEDLSDTEVTTATAAKRTRMLSPGAVHRAMEQKRKERERKRKEEMDRRWRERAEVRRGVLMDEVLRDVPLGSTTTTNEFAYGQPPPGAGDFDRDGQREENTNLNGTNENDAEDRGKDEEDEEAKHRAAIEESRRKIAELEKDRPLWEEHARRRRAQEEAEAKANARRKTETTAAHHASASSSSKHTQHQQQQHQKTQEHPSTGPSHAQKRARLRAELRAEEQNASTSGRWTPTRALERYHILSARFDTSSFAAGDPLTFELIPWPVFSPPGQLRVEDITWTRVEDFFARIRECLRREHGRAGGEERYRRVVGESHKRFHPDRWRGRNVLVGVEDEEERECLEGAANTVAQALTPLWKEATGR